MNEHKLLLISTGGTIAGEVAADKKSKDYEIQKADAFSDLLKDMLLYLHEEGVDVKITPREFAEVDSSDIKPSHWTGLIDIIQEEFDKYDSFVITHGTNTLGYTCAALAFAFSNPGKPIVLTGSQVPIGMPGSDARTNLENAIRVATWRRHDIHGVVCVFGSHIITGTRVKKDTEFDYDAFRTFGTFGSLGRIGRIININEDNLERHCKKLKSDRYPLARTKAALRVRSAFDPRIISLTEFPGMDYELLRELHKVYDKRGFIIRAFGAGDISTEAVDVLKYLKQQEIPVVATTQAPNGNANLQVNEPGRLLWKERLVVPAYDMCIESQTAKLMWLIAQQQDNGLRFEELGDLMRTDLRGEVNVIWEDQTTDLDE